MKEGRAHRVAMGFGLFAGAVFLAIQLVPYGHRHSNPPIVVEPRWDGAATRGLAARACFDCHSNETRWPWYSNVAPASWMVQEHVDAGRRALNFSEWNRASEEASEAAEAVLEGEMPPASYLFAHPEARLTAAERSQLARGLVATVGRVGTDDGDDD